MQYRLSTALRNGLLRKLSGNTTDVLLGDGTFATFASALAALTRWKVGSFTRDVATASGNQAVTGVGFQPTAIVFLMGNSLTRWSVGVDDNNGNVCIYGASAVTPDEVFASVGASIVARDAVDQYVGTVGSFDSDGFTVAWTKSGTPTGTITIGYLALR